MEHTVPYSPTSDFPLNLIPIDFYSTTQIPKRMTNPHGDGFIVTNPDKDGDKMTLRR